MFAVLALAGCADHSTIPVGCREGPDAVRAALARAPATVRVDGAAISKCFAREANQADVETIGATYLGVVQQLADRARAAPHSPASVQLGYLIGAIRRGAGRDYGVYYEMHRRVEDELNGVDVRSVEFMKGERAGERSG